MRTLLNPKWVFGITILPIVVLIGLLFGQYELIKSLLEPESVLRWKVFGGTLILLAVLHASYAAWCIQKRKALPVAHGIGVLVAYIGFLYLYMDNTRELFPWTIPRWMLSDDVFLYPLTFLMPTLAQAVLTLIVWFTPENKLHKAGYNFAGAVAVPVTWYLIFLVIVPLWRGVEGKFGEHVLVVALIAGTVVFLFLLARGVYILGAQKAGIWTNYQLVWKVLLGLVFPLLGLAVNNGLLFSPKLSFESGIFGNFTSLWFYGLALLNGILLCLPAPASAKLHLLLYLGRSIMLSYTLYFFLVFLPFLPVSVLAVLAIGTGFLMLTPLLLLLVQLWELTNDYAFLRQHFTRGLLVACLLVGSVVLPAVITFSYWHQRQTLHQTLAYLYHPDYTRHYEVDTTALAITLDAVRHHKDSRNNSLSGAYLPYLSTYFNWLVLDNLTLSNEKIARIEQVFFGKLPKNEVVVEQSGVDVPTPTITSLNSRSTYDAQQGAWVSWVNLEIKNPADGSSQAEFATTMSLPVGCWVSDYYLYVGQQRVRGLLAEKKAAMWVFSQIRNENKDPGILYYTGANQVMLRIFPFAAPEARRTGIQFLHKEPVTLQIAGRRVTLGHAAQNLQPIPVATRQQPEVVYVSAQDKAKLPLVTRKPVYHFILDASARQAGRKGHYAARIQALCKEYNLDPAQAQFSLVDTYVTPLGASKVWQQELNRHANTGGFYLAGALQRILADAATKPQPTYPVIVVVTDSLHQAVLDTDFSDYAAAYPESDLFYVLGLDGTLEAHSLRHKPWQVAFTTGQVLSSVARVRAWPNAQHPKAYLPEDEQASLVLRSARVNLAEENLVPGGWESALLLHGHWLAQVLHPETSAPEFNRGVRGSFQAGILTPLTSYLVVENEAQRAVLRRKQEQVLAGNDSLDLGEDTQRMTEPSEIILLLLLAALLLIRRARAKYKLGTQA
ncbi:MSEP-CTERM sorting domain-containing protein [Hymenobacter sp. GOD-10R]|uniref:MSEP-CTERM sorting domain-containing protein n=1 Tax=Hymenobacter sp. GOD-10R TaxID=3093922 RepID=UPI002D7A2E5A|nr:MSEP-CTERM sorting domain-containing protein [Hymenobacter sp. GOD-10R]WRQ30564.1 MSEP-CTERM sorting domain-containing protein [Hymenobacter sp. GOD-10R]